MDREDKDLTTCRKFGVRSAVVLFVSVFSHSGVSIHNNIYIFIAIARDESIFLDVLHFPMKNIKSRDLEATPMGGLTSKPIQ